MAIRLSNDLKKSRDEVNAQEGRPTGFDLKFSPGASFDLDTLLTEYNRNSSAALRIEVRDEKSFLDKLNLEVSNDFNGKLKTNIENIILKTFQKYSIKLGDDVSEKICNEIEREINDLTKVLGYDFTVKFDGMNVSAEYDGTAVKDHLRDLYQKYCEEYSKGVTNNGDLAINNNKIRLSPTVADYNKHLLSSNKSKNIQTPPGIHRPLVIWNEGTEDVTKPEDVNKLTEYEQEINYLKANMVLKSDVSDTISHNLDKLTSDGNNIPNINAVFNLFKVVLENERFSINDTSLNVSKLISTINEHILVVPEFMEIKNNTLIT